MHFSYPAGTGVPHVSFRRPEPRYTYVVDDYPPVYTPTRYLPPRTEYRPLPPAYYDPYARRCMEMVPPRPARRSAALTYSQCEILETDRGRRPSLEIHSEEKQRPVTMRAPSAPPNRQGMTLEEIKKLNEENLRLAKNAHVKHIWQQLQDRPQALMDDNTPSAAGLVSPTSSTVRLADVEKAREVLKSLNPNVSDTDGLLQALIDHMNGRKVELSPDMFSPSSRQQILLPVPGATLNAQRSGDLHSTASSGESGGFKASHGFRMRVNESETREYTVAKVVESPEVLAVLDLLDPIECGDLVTIAGENFESSRTNEMSVRVSDQSEVIKFYCPDDLCSLAFQSPAKYLPHVRDCTSSVLTLEIYEATPIYPFIKSVAVRAAALCKAPPHKVDSIVIERYLPGSSGAQRLHPSQHRRGTVIIPLTCASDGSALGSIGMRAAQLEFSARVGMALFLPSVHPDTIPSNASEDLMYKFVPDLRTEYSVMVTSHTDPLYLALVHISF